VPVTDLTYVIGSAGNSNGNGLAGERTLSAFGFGKIFLGSFIQNGAGISQVSTLVGNTPVESFRLTSPGFDDFRVRDITFTPQVVSLQRVNIDFRLPPTQQVPSYTDQGVTVTGSDNLNLSNRNGLGIVGGTSNLNVDTNEFVNFDFAVPVTDLSYVAGSAGNSNGNGLVGERTLSAFGVGNISLGSFIQNGAGISQVSTLVGNTPVESFRLTSPGFDDFRVRDITFTPQAVPFEFSPVGGVVILGGLWAGKRFAKSRKAAKKAK
jgi:hypothetical protein